MLATYLTFGFASACPGLEEISRAQRSKPSALLPMLRILLTLLHLFAKSCMCFACMQTLQPSKELHVTHFLEEECLVHAVKGSSTASDYTHYEIGLLNGLSTEGR